MTSPYGRSTVRVLPGTDIPAASQNGLRQASGSSAPMFGANGEINASSTASLMQAIGRIQATKTRVAYVNPGEKAAATAQLRAAFADPTGSQVQKIGDTVSKTIMETMRRHNFTRRCLVEDVPDGIQPTIRVSVMDVQAQVVIDKETVRTQDVRGYFFQPPEFELATYITLTNKDLAQIGPDLLDEKFNDGLVAIWTQEDRLTRQMFLGTQGLYNTPFGFSSFTPAVLAAMKNRVEAWGLTATTLLISYDIWNDIASNPDWQQFYSPLEKHDLALEGRLGRLMGMEIVTDGYIYDNLRVLNPGEVFVLGAPNTLGKVLQRKALEATAIDRRVVGESTRGWFLEQIQAQAVVNPRAVGYGSRI